jgi:uncharacterized membrane protein
MVMTKYLLAYATTLAVMVAIDLLWLGVIAKPLYQQGIGHLMADEPNLVAAAMFYLLFPLGLVIFAVIPNSLNELIAAGWLRAACAGALFGFFAYATYDLTNLATLKLWPVRLALIDIAWGTFVSALSAALGRVVFERVS